jgi:hypothetical protein
MAAPAVTPPRPAAACPTAAHRPGCLDHARRTGTATEPPRGSEQNTRSAVSTPEVIGSRQHDPAARPAGPAALRPQSAPQLPTLPIGQDSTHVLDRRTSKMRGPHERARAQRATERRSVEVRRPSWVVVFAALIAIDDVTIKSFGIGMVAAILVDATLVRMLLVPAVMRLLGRRNWWLPRPLDAGCPICTSKAGPRRSCRPSPTRNRSRLQRASVVAVGGTNTSGAVFMRPASLGVLPYPVLPRTTCNTEGASGSASVSP